MGSYTGYLVETFLTLVVVCVLAFAVLWGAKRLGVARASGSIKLVGQLPLDQRRAIYLVRIGEQVIVVGASEGGLTKLGEMPASEVPQDAPTKPLRFADVLARVRPKAVAEPKEDSDA
jgi:flagellar biosynthetic protein FliO